MPDTCQHLDQIDLDATATSPDQCLTCVGMGDDWVHLRMCCICGNVGCCDSSKNKHATAHFNDGGHPIMRSHMPGEDWKWCFVEEIGWE